MALSIVSVQYRNPMPTNRQLLIIDVLFNFLKIRYISFKPTKVSSAAYVVQRTR